jgi:hypothetical protein
VALRTSSSSNYISLISFYKKNKKTDSLQGMARTGDLKHDEGHMSDGKERR